MLVITYDEHGGFYDHVPPPGTRLGPEEWRGGLPRMHRDGPTYLGPRVPTFVISPFVNPGTVSHALFDHTSIIKTILVRHRARLVADQFKRFGARVAMINHLGAALDRDDARPGVPQLAHPCFADDRRTRIARRTTPAASPPGTPRRRPTAAPVDEEESTDFKISLARAMLPKRR
jgi:phospholipase C